METAKPMTKTLEERAAELNSVSNRLVDYNLWRRGDDLIKMPDPKELGKTIDKAVNKLRWNPYYKEPSDGGRYLILTNADRLYIGTYFKINESFTLDHDLDFLNDEDAILYREI